MFKSLILASIISLLPVTANSQMTINSPDNVTCLLSIGDQELIDLLVTNNPGSSAVLVNGEAYEKFLAVATSLKPVSVPTADEVVIVDIPGNPNYGLTFSLGDCVTFETLAGREFIDEVLAIAAQ